MAGSSESVREGESPGIVLPTWLSSPSAKCLAAARHSRNVTYTRVKNEEGGGEVKQGGKEG